jgi:hypothetical protein
MNPRPGYSLSEAAVDEVRGLFGQRSSWAPPLLRGAGAYDPGSDYNNCVAQFRNDSGEEIPANGCMRITGSATVGGQQYLLAEKPNTYGSQYLHWFNGDQPVATGKFGTCYKGSFVRALYDTADGTPSVGQQWGPRSGTWKLRANTGGWQILGGHSSGVVTVQHMPMLRVFGKIQTACLIGEYADVNVWVRSSLLPPFYTSLSGVTITGVANIFGNIPQYRFVNCEWDYGSNGDTWTITAAACA